MATAISNTKVKILIMINRYVNFRMTFVLELRMVLAKESMLRKNLETK